MRAQLSFRRVQSRDSVRSVLIAVISAVVLSSCGLAPAALGEPAEWTPRMAVQDHESLNLPILVSERQCASGRSAEGRVRLSVTETDDTVEIAALVVPRLGGQSCPANPATPAVVELAGPLGDRALVGAAETWEPEDPFNFDLPRALASPSPAVEVVATHADDNAWFEPDCGAFEPREWTTNPGVVFQEPEAVLAKAVESIPLSRSGWHAYVRGDGLRIYVLGDQERPSAVLFVESAAVGLQGVAGALWAAEESTDSGGSTHARCPGFCRTKSPCRFLRKSKR